MTKEEFITERTRIISEMLDNPDKYGLYPTTRCFTELDLLYDKIIFSLKSQLSEAGEEKPIIKKCRQCMFFDLDEHCVMSPYCIFKLATPLKG